MRQVEMSEIVQTGKGERAEPVQWRVLHRKLLKPAKTPESELLDVANCVAVQIKFPQRFVALESVRF